MSDELNVSQFCDPKPNGWLILRAEYIVNPDEAGRSFQIRIPTYIAADGQMIATKDAPHDVHGMLQCLKDSTVVFVADK